MTKEEDLCFIGVDIGGTNMKSVLIKGDRVVDGYTLGTPTDNLEHFWAILKAMIDPLVKSAHDYKLKVGGIGLSVAGLCDTENGKIIKAPNIPLLDGIFLADMVKDEFKVDIKIDNDANCFTRNEALSGAGRKSENVFGITIGTGVGSGWWLNGDIYHGANGTTNEISKMILEDKKNLEEIYHKITQNNPSKLADEAYRGDDLAIKMYEEIGYYLGAACANIVNLINPEIIVFGGGVMQSSDLFLPKIKKVAHDLILNPEAKKTKIVKSKFKEDCCAIGSVGLF